METNCKKYRHIVWDWNGTLLDDACLCVDILNQLLTRRAMSIINLTEYQEKFDFPVKEYYRGLGFDFSVEPFEVLAEEFIRQYNLRRAECRLQKDAKRALEFFSEAGCTQSILSAYQHDWLIEVVQDFGLKDFFTRLVGLNDYYAVGKVENGIRLIRDMKLDSREVLFIGDTIHDFATAKAMAVDCILIPSGHQSRKKLESCCCAVLNSLEEICQI